MTEPIPPPSAELLERRVDAFVLHLYRSVLIARAAFPVLALVAVVLAPPAQSNGTVTQLVWLALTCWTIGTLRFAWSRLDWIVRMPGIVWVELAVLLALIVIGFGSRSWHLLHSFVPLLFAAFFLPPLAGRVMACGMVAGLWLPHLLNGIWPGLPVEQPTDAVTPTALIVAAWALVTYVRRLLGEARELIDAERRSGASLRTIRARLASQLERQDLHRRVWKRLRAMTVALELPASVDGPDRPGLEDVLTAIRQDVGALADSPSPPGRQSLGDVLERALASTAAFGAFESVRIDEAASDARPRDGDAALRLFTEAFTNALRHGGSPCRLQVEQTRPGTFQVRVENPGTRAPQLRAGHMGLIDMGRDAVATDATVRHDLGDGTVTTTIRLTATAHADDGGSLADSRALISRVDARRANYERGVLAVRLGFALLTTVMLFVRADAHRTLLPVMVVTAAALIVWNAILLIGWPTLRQRVLEHTEWVWFDAAVMVGIVTFQGGMSTPWIPLSMGCILSVVHFRAWRGGLVLVALLSAGLLVGYALMRTLPVDDAGTLAQDMPFGWVFNATAYGLVLAVASALRWVFDRFDEAGDAYAATVDAEVAAMRAEAHQEAVAETRRDLHAHLQQHVSAARLRLGSMISGPIEPVDDALLEMRRELTRLMSELDSDHTADAPDPV